MKGYEPGALPVAIHAAEGKKLGTRNREPGAGAN